MHPIRQILIKLNIFRNTEVADQESINGKVMEHVNLQKAIKLESDTEKDKEEEKCSDKNHIPIIDTQVIKDNEQIKQLNIEKVKREPGKIKHDESMDVKNFKSMSIMEYLNKSKVTSGLGKDDYQENVLHLRLAVKDEPQKTVTTKNLNPF